MDTTPDPALASPEAARAEIDRIRADSAHAWAQPNHPGHADALTRMDALYRRVTPPEPGTAQPDAHIDTPPAEAPDANALSPLTVAHLPPGYTWDEPTLTELGAMGHREAIDPGLVREGPALVARLLAERAPVLTGEEAEDQLAEVFGSSFDTKMAGAGEVWALLPKKIQADLERVGLKTHPEFVKYLVRVHEHRWDPMTDAGFARIKARGLAALAADAKKGG